MKKNIIKIFLWVFVTHIVGHFIQLDFNQIQTFFFFLVENDQIET